MAITTSVRTSYTWRMLIIAFVTLILGLWGLYDFFWAIPAKERSYDRYLVLTTCQAALESDQPADAVTEATRTALRAVAQELNRTVREQAEEGGIEVETEEDLQTLVDSMDVGDKAWFELLLRNQLGLRSTRRSGNLTASPLADQAYQLNGAALQSIGDVEKPAKLDRYVKGLLFLPLIPFAPWFVFRLLAARRRRYTLEDDGSLVSPEGRWSPNVIADIDMDRWMAKSIAFAVHSDGSRVKLDDYIYRDMHLIVGGIAHRFYPDRWHEDGKQVKSSDGDGAGDLDAIEDGSEEGEPAEREG